MAASHEQDLDSEMSRLSINSPTIDSSSQDELLLKTRRQSSVSSEDSWQSGAFSSRTPASSLYSEDFETEFKPRQKSTVIHEEAETAAELQIAAASTAAVPPTTPPESPILPPDDLIANHPKRVLQAVEYDLPYTHPTMPWDKFYSSRADYPNSMFETFLKYHQGPLDVLHDLGAGSGLAADGLLSALQRQRRQRRTTDAQQQQQHGHASANSASVVSASPKLPRTILSDPGRENLGITSRFVHARHPDVAMECWQARGEDQDQFLAPASVDMYVVPLVRDTVLCSISFFFFFGVCVLCVFLLLGPQEEEGCFQVGSDQDRSLIHLIQ